MNETLVIIACVLVLGFFAYEYMKTKWPMLEGFEDLGKPNFFSKYFPRRYDIVPGQKMEDYGYLRDPRYHESYADVQLTGAKK